jgi:hypothetical protein
MPPRRAVLVVPFPLRARWRFLPDLCSTELRRNSGRGRAKSARANFDHRLEITHNAAYMALRNDSPTGIGGRGRSPNILSFSGKNHDGICLSLARSGPSSSLFHVAGSSRLAAAGTLCAAVVGAGLAATADGWIASGSLLRRFGSALGACSDIWVRRAAATGADFAGFGAEEAVDATAVRSGCVSLSLRAMAAARASRAAFSIVAGEIWTTAVAGAGPLSICPRK